MKIHLLGLTMLTAIVAVTLPVSAQSGAVIPGTGLHIDYVSDTFEADGESWKYYLNSPKASRENDEQLRFPRGYSANLRWFEGPERGQPDMMKVVATPQGGLPGSRYSLLVRTLHSGVPGYLNNKVEQDDLIVDVVSRVGMIPVAEVPSVVTRVYLPPADEWENRSGPQFGFRVTTNLHMTKTEEQPANAGRFRARRRPRTYQAVEQYWPGIWIHFRSHTDPQFDTDSAFLAVRGNRLGHDFTVMEIPQEDFGWWTLGMSITGNGQVHYFAKKGVADLTADDHLTSQFPYSYRAEKFETMFFNYCNKNDGKSWSTPFVIDDPSLYVMKSQRVASIMANKKAAEQRQAARTQPNNAGR